ncbi:MAG: RRXRR domain-containing protein [Ardenticatenales bacterium]|nr:RRXRR domain-containing protein [Ardenticatenales bacterium]
MQVCVVNQQGRPLMPTTPRKARRLLQAGKARIVSRTPFTIQLLYGTRGYTQPITLGVDAGYATVGFAAVTEKEELVGGELKLLSGMSERLAERAMYRGGRRRRTRHRQPRFDNRRRIEGWLAPSIQHKLDSHLQLIERLCTMLPITRILIEVASEKALERWSVEAIEQNDKRAQGRCCCSNALSFQRSNASQVHHLGYWRGDGSDRPANLITLCTRCYTPENHLPGGLLWDWEPRLASFRPETFMSLVRWRLVEAVGAEATYGYLTKSRRIELDLPKSHANDAFVIAGGSTQRRATSLLLEQVRRNRRALQTFYDAKYIDTRTGEVVKAQGLNNGRRTRNRTLSGENLRRYRGPQVSKGRVSIRRRRYPYQPGDLVRYEGQVYRVQGMGGYGRNLKLAGRPKEVKAALVSPVRWRKGICQQVP